MFADKLIQKRSSQELMDLQVLAETLDGLARASGMRWYSICFEKA